MNNLKYMGSGLAVNDWKIKKKYSAFDNLIKEKDERIRYFHLTND